MSLDVTPPSDPTSVSRRLTLAERAIEMMRSARSLTMSAIGNGGLLVNRLGKIVIEGGGSLVIETGNLTLGSGVIEGKALKNQFEATFRTSNGRIDSGDDWTSSRTLTVTRPEWAARSVVTALMSIDTRSPMQIRANIDGNRSCYVNPRRFETYDDGHGVNSVEHGWVTSRAEFTVTLETKWIGSDYPRGDSRDVGNLAVSVLFYR